MKCQKHPKYKGSNKPKTQCVGCLAVFIGLSSPRSGVQPTRVFKDKTKYNRKQKHRIDNE